jgi:hypothetical protein
MCSIKSAASASEGQVREIEREAREQWETIEIYLEFCFVSGQSLLMFIKTLVIEGGQWFEQMYI